MKAVFYCGHVFCTLLLWKMTTGLVSWCLCESLDISYTCNRITQFCFLNVSCTLLNYVTSSSTLVVPFCKTTIVANFKYKKNIDDKLHQIRVSSFNNYSSVTSPGVSLRERARRCATRQRLVEEIRSPGRSQARGGKRNHIKDGDPHRNGD